MCVFAFRQLVCRCVAIVLLSLISLDAAGQDAAGFFLAVGGVDGKDDDGHKLEGQFGTIYTSIDGESWKQVFKGGPITEEFSHAKNNLLRCATYGSGRFVVTGNPNSVVVSDDGVTWRLIKAPNGSFSVEYGNGNFVAPNAYGFMTSVDGLSWQSHRPKVDFPIWGKEGAGHVRKIVFGNGAFVCIGDQRLGVTKDGKTWSHHIILSPDNRPGRCVLLFGNGRFVLLSENAAPQWSTDGIDWLPIVGLLNLATKGKFGSSGVFDGEQFLVSNSAWSDKNKIIYSSADGVTWKKATENAGDTVIHAAGKGILLQGKGWSQSFRVSSDQGKTWKDVKAGVPNRKVYFFNGQQILGQSGG